MKEKKRKKNRNRKTKTERKNPKLRNKFEIILYS
jgi:hypothetical protein